MNMQDLARRAVACKAWRWMPGMACIWDPPRGIGGQQVMIRWARVADLPMGPLPITHGVIDTRNVYRVAFPDLVDRATLGCLLHLVREHLGDDGVCLRRAFRPNGAERWTCEWLYHAPSVAYPMLYQTYGETEAEALVKALEIEVGND